MQVQLHPIIRTLELVPLDFPTLIVSVLRNNTGPISSLFSPESFLFVAGGREERKLLRSFLILYVVEFLDIAQDG